MTFSRTDSMFAAVLLIESDPLMLTAMGAVLDSCGHHVVLARSEAVAMDSIAKGEFDAIVLSIEQLEAGCQFAGRLRSQANTCDTPIIFLVPNISAEGSSALAAHGGVFSMLKPAEPDSLIDLVEKALWLPHIAQSHNAMGRKSQLKTRSAEARDWVRL